MIKCFLLIASTPAYAQQDFDLIEQLNGRYDFTFVGNTMNYGENNIQISCQIQTSSSATLNLSADDVIEKAYLYWSGSGSGVPTIKLNEEYVTAENLYVANTLGLSFFVAHADVTQQLQNTGNGTYTVSEFDLTSIISSYCPNATNYAGWTLVVFYENQNLPINQLSLFDGFQYMSGSGNGAVIGEISITLDDLYVMDNVGAKIGFVAWEGDSTWFLHESLLLNGEKLSDEPLNPENNAFNSTNSITGSWQLYNMDLDIYDAEDYIFVGDTTAEVKLTSGQDFVLISTIVTKFNNSHPDATIAIETATAQCEDDFMEVFYTVYNNESYNVLPANTPIAVYIDGVFVQTTYTQNDIEIDGSQSGSVMVNLDGMDTQEIEIVLVVDDQGDGTGIVFEIDENNNHSEPYLLTLLNLPLFNDLEDLVTCDQGNQTAVFDFYHYESLVKQDSSDQVSFHTSNGDASANINPIINTSSYVVQNEFPKEIFVRIDNGNCHSITSFWLEVDNCSLVIVIDDVFTACDSSQIELFYTLSNTSTNYILPADTPIEIFANGNLIQTVFTQNELLPQASESASVIITVAENTIDVEFVLSVSVTASNLVIQASSQPYVVFFASAPLFNDLDDLTACNTGSQTATFDFSEYQYLVKQNQTDLVSFHTSYQDAMVGVNVIFDASSYTTQGFPKEIFVRIDNGYCHSITSFILHIKNCPPTVYNAISPNNDGRNDEFTIEGLYDIFENFELYVYSRWGVLIWKGNNNIPKWRGEVTERNAVFLEQAPEGTYYYILELNDPDYPQPLQGFLYLTR